MKIGVWIWRVAWVILGFCSAAFYPTVLATTLTVEVVNFDTAQGPLMVAVCDSEKSYKKRNCRLVRKADASGKKVSIAFHRLPARVYAGIAYQDLNGNGKLDTSFFGFPKEPVGFTGNSSLRFGPPGFDEAGIKLGDQNVRTVIKLIRN